MFELGYFGCRESSCFEDRVVVETAPMLFCGMFWEYLRSFFEDGGLDKLRFSLICILFFWKIPPALGIYYIICIFGEVYRKVETLTSSLSGKANRIWEEWDGFAGLRRDRGAWAEFIVSLPLIREPSYLPIHVGVYVRRAKYVVVSCGKSCPFLLPWMRGAGTALVVIRELLICWWGKPLADDQKVYELESWKAGTAVGEVQGGEEIETSICILRLLAGISVVMGLMTSPERDEVVRIIIKGFVEVVLWIDSFYTCLADLCWTAVLCLVGGHGMLLVDVFWIFMGILGRRVGRAVDFVVQRKEALLGCQVVILGEIGRAHV